MILDAAREEAFETELVRNVITLMTVFSARLYGKHSRENRRSGRSENKPDESILIQNVSDMLSGHESQKHTNQNRYTGA